MTDKIKYPYLPEGRTIKYVDMNNKFMKAAFKQAKTAVLNATNEAGKSMTVTSVVIVKDNEIISSGINGDGYHQINGCVRLAQNIPPGTKYYLCDGCKEENHGEKIAIKKALKKDFDLNGADLYLWGCWWCCKSCWAKMIQVGIRNVYLLQDSHKLFIRGSKDSHIGDFEFFEKMIEKS